MQDPQVKVATDHGRDESASRQCGAKRGQAPRDQLAHLLRDGDLVGGAPQPLLGAQEPDDLRDEERVALRLRVDRVDERVVGSVPAVIAMYRATGAR